MNRETLIVFLGTTENPLRISELSRKSGLTPQILRGRVTAILNAGHTTMYKGKRCAVFTKEDLRPVGEKRKTPIQSDKPASKDLHAILNKGFGGRQ